MAEPFPTRAPEGSTYRKTQRGTYRVPLFVMLASNKAFRFWIERKKDGR
jgi:hypothetical protein